MAVMFGHLGTGYYVFDPTWEWDGSTWSEVRVFGPVTRRSHAMVYDSLRSSIVLFGGAAACAGIRLSDMWVYNVPLIGDFDRDGDVDLSDFLIFQQNFTGSL